MYSTDVITPQHRARTAVIYIRQSTPHQALSHQESLRLQYALTERAQALGWAPEAIEVVDSDVGHSAASARHREGFNTLVGQVTLGQVGIILSYDVTRLSRNCSDWYPLLDLCSYKGCLIADVDGLYDPATANGRLLLGLKGTLSEWELHTIRARMTAGLLNKAARGDLALALPTGLERDAQGRVHKDPNLEVQSRIALVFSTFLQRRSASKVLEFFNAQGLRLPRRDRFGEVMWKRPTVAAILTILKHPAYAGTFTYGRTRTLRTGTGRAATKRLTMEQWRMRVPDKYPAYISWTMFEQIQSMLHDNHAEYDRNKTRGIPRPGKALLHGLVYCGACGHKMVVQYKGGAEYLCNYLRQQYRVPVCQYVPADPVDVRVVAAFSRRYRPSNSMCIRRRWPRSVNRPHGSRRRTGSNSSGCGMRPRSVNANFAVSIPTIAWSRRNWSGAGKQPSASSRQPKQPMPNACRPRTWRRVHSRQRYVRPSWILAGHCRICGRRRCCHNHSAKRSCVV